MIKRLVEKLYYKCYPDRKNEHEIATMSLPVIKEERHNVRHLEFEYLIPMYEVELFGLDRSIERRKFETRHNIGDRISDYITFRQYEDKRAGVYVLRARLDVLERERGIENERSQID
jgi:hypothetical protein